jgi:hypothetical protein
MRKEFLMQTLLLKNNKKGGKVSFASKRGDGCITKGKTKGRII